MVVVLATKKSNPPAAAFGLKIVYILLGCVQILQWIKKIVYQPWFAFSNWEIQSYWYHVWAQICLFLNKLSPKFRANQNKRDCCLCFSIFWCTYWFWYITSFVKKTFVNNNCLVFQISKISLCCKIIVWSLVYDFMEFANMNSALTGNPPMLSICTLHFTVFLELLKGWRR